MKRDRKRKNLEAEGSGNSAEVFDLQLFITGMSPKSISAINNVKQICEEYLNGQYKLEVIDIYQNPELAKSEHILASPTLIRKSPLPLRRMLGDMSNTEHVLLALGLREKKKR